METFQFDLVTPDRQEISALVTQVQAPGSLGDFGVLPKHAPLISTLRPGIITIFSGNGEVEKLFVTGGFAEVNNNRCTILADRAIRVADMDRTAIQQKISEITAFLAEQSVTEENKQKYKRELDVYTTMLRAVA